MITVWLLVTVIVAGEPPVTIEDSKQPDLQTCLVHAAEAIGKTAEVVGTYQVDATCSLMKKEHPL
jgi:hypothetical protein